MLARTWLYTLFWLAMWVVVPALALGWTPVTISSGSMEPAVHRGDVLLLEPPEHPLDVGRVATYRTERGLISHRVVSVLDDGTYRTMGDANRTLDSTPLRTDQVEGAARIVVPMIGLGPRWLADGELQKLALLFLVTLLAIIGAPWHGDRVSGPADAAGRRVGSITLVLAMTALGVVLPASPARAWSASTDTVGSWAADVLAAPAAVSTSYSCGILGVLNSIAVDWTASTSSVEGYRILRSTDAGALEVMNGGSLVTGTSWADSDVDARRTYRYVIRAVAGSWTSTDTGDNEATITTGGICLV